MKYVFHRYIYGMLQTSDKKNVGGDLQPIAYSAGFSGNLQREVYKKVRLGLNGDLLRESGHAYGFFPLSDKDFIAAHYELMDLTEPTSRGRPVFSEFFHITSSQLEDINWNLYPIFKSFTNIQYYEQVANDIPPAEIEFNGSDWWLDSLRQFPVQVEAILVRYLSSSEKINIVSSPNDHGIRLRIMCALFQCIPQRYRNELSFATLAKETSDSVKIFFSSYASGSEQLMDWSAPMIPNLSGVVYANWVVDLIQGLEADDFRKRVLNLVLPWKTDQLKTYGDEVDLAIRYDEWRANQDEHLKTKVMSQLEQLARQINEFSSIFTTKEAEEWLSFLLIFVMKLTAYDIGVESLSHYTFMITDRKSRLVLIQKIVSEIFFQQKEENLQMLAGFITHITEHGIKTNQDVLLEFCKEILLQCLLSKDYRNALGLWAKLKQLEWVNSVIWFKAALDGLPQIQTKEDFVFIVNDIGCPASRQALEALLALLKRSTVLSSHLPENFGFLQTLNFESPQEYLHCVSKSFLEINSYKWLSVQIRFGYENFVGFLEILPFLTAAIGIKIADNLLKYATFNNDDLLSALIAFSIILNQAEQDHSKHLPINAYLETIKKCQLENINIGLEILQKHWEHFSVEQLEPMLNLLGTKPSRHTKINVSVMEIRTTIHKKNRIKKIQDIFGGRIKRDELGHLIYEFVSDFARSGDVNAWKLFEKHIRDRKLSKVYRKHLIQILLENQFFKIADEKLKEINILLGNAGLLYEADTVTFWLIFQRGIYINPYPAINRTLSLYCVPPYDAGVIIGYAHGFDKKRAHSLANKLVQMESVEAEKLVGKLDSFIVKNPTRSFENKLKALVSDLTPDVIWIENCKSLSRNIKSELRKIQNRRH